MKSRPLLLLFLIAFLVTFCAPAHAVLDGYHNGVLVHARASQSQQGKNCVTLTVLVEELVFVAQQCATMPWNAFVAAEFTEQGDVQVRVEEDKLLLRRPNGKDLRAHIVRKALLRKRVDLEDFWKRNSADRDDVLFPEPQEPNSMPGSMH